MIPSYDFSEVRGLADAIAACERAATDHAAGRAGTLLLMGPPGTGKTMIARRLTTIMPPLGDHAQRWLAAEYEALGADGFLAPRRQHGVDECPFRAPHHTISTAALVGAPGYAVHGRAPVSCVLCQTVVKRGGTPDPYHRFHTLPAGSVPRPGELQLARFGVLFLDELSEFQKGAIEALAGALRAMAPGTRPMIVASATTCLCGWRDSGVRECACTEGQIKRHTERLDALVRILGGFAHVAHVQPVSLDEMRGAAPGPSSAEIRARVVAGAGRVTP